MNISRVGKIFVICSILIFANNISNASEIFSCKHVSDARVGSDRASGSTLYGDSEYGRRVMSRQKPKILILEDSKLTFGGQNFAHLGYSGQHFYADSHYGLVEVYKWNNEVTLFITRSNGNQSQKSNYLDVNLWHCNQ